MERQLIVPIRFAGLAIDEGFRADLLIQNSLVIELKSVESIAPVHSRQLLTERSRQYFLTLLVGPHPSPR